MDSPKELSTELFTGRMDGDVAVVQVRDRLPVRLSDLAAKGTAFAHLEAVAASDSIRSMVILDPHQASRKEEYLDFLSSLRNQDSGFTARLCNAANQVVTQLATFSKPMVAAGHGRIVSLLLNMGLAADYRVVSTETVFVNPGISMGLPSKGGAAYFLSRLAGPARAMEFMLSMEEISAEAAQDWGLVNEVVPAQELEQAAIAAARRLGTAPPPVFGTIKTMLLGDTKELKRCLALEDECIVRRLNDPDFWEQVERMLEELSG